MTKSVLIYLASPYNHVDPDVRERRYRRALEYTTTLLNMGAFVYSPIVHNHPVAIESDLGREWEFWKDYDCAMIDRCDIVAVAQIEGWEESVGVSAETKYAHSCGKPIVYLADPLMPEGFNALTRSAIDLVSAFRSRFDLAKFSKVNLQRCTSPDGFNHALDSWSEAEWTNAMAGELGEAANLTKKLLRHRDGVAGNNKAEDKSVSSLKERAAHEIADAIVYGDLAIQRLGFDTSTMLRDVFNAKSDELKCSIRYEEE